MSMRGAKIIIDLSNSRELVMKDLPYSLMGGIFLLIAALTLLLGYVFMRRTSSRLGRKIPILFWFFPLLLATPFALIGAVVATWKSTVCASSESGVLNVREMILGISVRSDTYPLGRIREARVGVGDVCRFLYIDMIDGSSPKLLGCTDRPGYVEAADAINSFLDARGHGGAR